MPWLSGLQSGELFLQIARLISQDTFSPCLPCKLLWFPPPQPILPSPFPAPQSNHVWLCEFHKCKSLVTLSQLYLYYCFSPNDHDHPTRSLGDVGDGILGQTDRTALGSVSWPAAGFLLPSVCCIAEPAGLHIPRYLGNEAWVDSWVSGLLTHHELCSPLLSVKALAEF